MRLPIYRRLDEGLKILGLSLKEIAILGIVFVGLGQLLSFWKWGRLIALISSVALFFVIRFVNSRLESHYIEKTIRYLMHPSSLGKCVVISWRKNK